ncbi:MAG: hypothetical protein KA314_25575 [Chloroflexi bacterium]|nr:hypothetical protein [Chloroflexota bacterium]MBP8059220.1 hypothetical protein [Chloroflexota bacterium]
MSRVINVNNPTKVRNYARRTIAEILYLLPRKQKFDEEAKDMAAAIVYCLREIEGTVETSAVAWEKRDYWMKAERFMREWEWTKEMAANYEDIIREEAWDLLPELLADLMSHFTDMDVKSFMRKPDAWQGAYKRLLADTPRTTPWS